MQTPFFFPDRARTDGEWNVLTEKRGPLHITNHLTYAQLKVTTNVLTGKRGLDQITWHVHIV